MFHGGVHPRPPPEENNWFFSKNFSILFCVVVWSPWNTFCMILQIPRSNFGWVRAFSLAAIMKSTLPHDYAHCLQYIKYSKKLFWRIYSVYPTVRPSLKPIWRSKKPIVNQVEKVRDPGFLDARKCSNLVKSIWRL